MISSPIRLVRAGSPPLRPSEWPQRPEWEPNPACLSLQVSLNVKLPTGSDVVFDLDPLSYEIDPQASSYRVLAPKIELNLTKKVVGAKWNKLEQDPKQSTSAPAQTISTSSPAHSCDRRVTFPTRADRRTRSPRHTQTHPLRQPRLRTPTLPRPRSGPTGIRSSSQRLRRTRSSRGR